MNRLVSAVLIGFALVPLLAAADATAPVSAGHADAVRVFAHQAAAAPAPSGAHPALIGSYLWSGRADLEYRPFFQWELRLKSGSKRLDSLKARITTFDGLHHPLVVGDWQTLPDLDPATDADASFHLHCTTFAAWQLDLSWNGGSAAWISGDKVGLPMSLDDGDGCALVTNANNDPPGPTTDAGPVTVTFNLLNVGRKPAAGVSETIHFRDDSGKEVFQAVHHAKPDPLPAGAAQEETEVVKRVPPFTSMDISCEQAAPRSDDPGFTGAKDIEIAFIHPDGKKVHAKVRNGLGTDMSGVVVHLAFKDKDGDSVGEGDIPVGDLKPDEIRAITGDIPLTGAWSDYEVGWSTPDVTTDSTAAGAAPATPATAAP